MDGAAARLTANDAKGQSGGAEKHTLVEAELANHDHDFTSGVNKVVTDPTGFALVTVQSGTGQNGVVGAIDGTISNITANRNQSSGGGAHNNMQPYQVVNWMIFTGSAA